MKEFTENIFLTMEKEKGQDLAEYALLIGLLALVIIFAATIIGQSFSGLFSSFASTIDTWW